MDSHGHFAHMRGIIFLVPAISLSREYNVKWDSQLEEVKKKIEKIKKNQKKLRKKLRKRKKTEKRHFPSIIILNCINYIRCNLVNHVNHHVNHLCKPPPTKNI